MLYQQGTEENIYIALVNLWHIDSWRKCHFGVNIFLNKNQSDLIDISLRLLLWGSNDNMPACVVVMAWLSSLTLCVDTQPQWVNLLVQGASASIILTSHYNGGWALGPYCHPNAGIARKWRSSTLPHPTYHLLPSNKRTMGDGGMVTISPFIWHSDHLSVWLFVCQSICDAWMRWILAQCLLQPFIAPAQINIV